MNTTSIFAEILVIGIHSLTSFIILYLSFNKQNSFSIDAFFSITFFIPVLACAYLLGIIVDRLSDSLLRPHDHKLRKRFTEDTGDFEKFNIMRYQLMIKSKEIGSLLEYTRSKLRIVRASILNFILTTIAVVTFINMKIIQGSSFLPRVFCSLIVMLIGFGFILLSYFTFKSLVKSYITSVISAYKFIKIEKPEV